MKKITKGAICLGLCAVMSFGFVGCKKEDLNPETRALKLSSGALDGNFNPFFYTAQNDGDIAAMTQIGMLTSDADGNPACGDDQPTVVKAYNITMYDAGGAETQVGSSEGYTLYEFVIKNGVKFSDGTPLTIHDVLFNLYVYLDPAYTGSSTIYSTDIEGLKDYRQQRHGASQTDAQFEKEFYDAGQERVQALINWATNKTDYYSEEDYNTVQKLFYEEVTSDYSTVATSWAETYKETNNFTAAWQAYLYQEGIVEIQRDNRGHEIKYEDGKDEKGNPIYRYKTTLDLWDASAAGGHDTSTRGAQHYIDEINAATTSDKVSAYASANSCDEATAKEALERECAIDIAKNWFSKSTLGTILTVWATATNAVTDFAMQEKSAYYASLPENQKVHNISGITVKKNETTFHGMSLGAAHDVLKIKVKGVDPKAIWNFAFTVAPMHYYSDKAHTDAANAANVEDPECSAFGVELGDYNFFKNELNAPAKNGLPVGAGAYQASTRTNEAATKGSDFFSNNIVYFMRNDNFTTLGSGIDNAKIKYVHYFVTADDKLLDSVGTGAIDYAQPSATPSNQKTAKKNKKLSTHTYRTGGYGYVGINPKYVPDLEVRRAIMKALDTTLTVRNYYNSELAEVIYRPMSLTSWAYPTNCTPYEATEYTTDNAKIKALVETPTQYGQQKWQLGTDGKYYDRDGNKLSITFTIAGETKNHPGWDMFTKARDRLNGLGFDITVTTDVQALKKLNSGKLAVWAAAWSSGIDPDPYQIYHKDSKATSVNNWNYSGILNDTTGVYTREKATIEAISTLIDQGRSMLDQTARKNIYAQCLDKIMELSVELPTYQRNDLCVWNKKRIKESSLFLDAARNFNLNPIGKIWEIEYV